MDFNKIISLDCETTGLNLFHGCKPFAVSTCDHKGQTTFWELKVDPFTREPQIPETSKEAIRKHIEGKTLVFHNAKFDLRALATIGIDATQNPIEETLIASHILDSGESHHLKDLAVKYCNIPADDQEELRKGVCKARRTAKKKGWPISEKVAMDYWLPKAVNPSSNFLQEYAVKDAIRTMQLAMVLLPEIEKQGFQEIYEREKALVPIVYQMEERGIVIKPNSWKEMYKELKTRTDKADKRACSVVNRKGLNIRSSQQLRQVIYSQLSCPIVKTTDKGTPSTDKVAITELLAKCRKSTSIKKRFLTYLQEFRETKTKVGYLENYEKSAIKGRYEWVLHPSFNSTGTRFTRFSSSNPNGQNIDELLRSIFGPRKGHSWFCIDYSQLELRIFAVAAKEEVMLKALTDGKDIHQITADAFGISRKIAKNIDFAMIYGAGVPKITQMAQMGGGTADPDIFKRTYPRAVKFMQEVQKDVRRDGYIHTLDGYRLSVDKDKPYIGVDAICQGTAGSLIKSAMVRVGHYLRESTRIQDCGINKPIQLLLNVHDELIFEVDNSLSIEIIKQSIFDITEIMEEAGAYMNIPVYTPVEVKRTKTKWSEAKVYKL